MVDILHKIAVKAPINEVYKALATREGVAGWWTEDTQGDSRVGGTLGFSFKTDGVEVGSMAMKVVQLQPAKRVLWETLAGPAEWVGTQISFDLHQDGEYVVLLFKHQGWREPVEFMHHCSTKWAVFMLSLKSLLETGTGAPSPRDLKIDNWN